MNKLLFIFSFLCSVTYGQISIQELISVSKMDSEGFEIYAMSKGFSFYELDNKENAKGITMFKGEYGNERYLTWYSKYFNEKNHSNYQTGNTSELQKLFKELGALGFKLEDRSQFDGYYTKDYSRRGKENVAIFIRPDWVEIGYSFYE